MKFHGKITVYRYEDNWNPDITEIYAEHFESPSIQAAKAKLTKIANETELFSWVQSWDNENTGPTPARIYAGSPGAVRPLPINKTTGLKLPSAPV